MKKQNTRLAGKNLHRGCVTSSTTSISMFVPDQLGQFDEPVGAAPLPSFRVPIPVRNAA